MPGICRKDKYGFVAAIWQLLGEDLTSYDQLEGEVSTLHYLQSLTLPIRIAEKFVVFIHRETPCSAHAELRSELTPVQQLWTC
jgi:hypothetical protein